MLKLLYRCVLLLFLCKSLKILKTPEFLPYIVFIAAPSIAAMKVMYEEGRRFARGNRVRVITSANDFMTVMCTHEATNCSFHILHFHCVIKSHNFIIILF